MSTKLVNTAADVILRALTQNRTAAGIALALESAQLLQSPETAAELERLRARLAEYERPADEDPIRYTLTETADAEDGVSGPCDCGEGAVHYTADDCPAKQRAATGDVMPQVAKLRSILAGQREQAGGAS